MKNKNIKNLDNLYFFNEIRGVILVIFLICNMIYHIIGDYSIKIDMAKNFFYNLGLFGFFIFIFISGVESGIFKNNIKRAAIDIIFGLFFLFIKIFFIKNIKLIWYDDCNIFLLNGIYIFIYCLIERFAKIFKFPIIGIFFSSAVFIILDKFKDLHLIEIKKMTIRLSNFFKYPINLKLYINCLILFFLFFAGSFFSNYLKQNRVPKFFSDIHIKFFAKIGENFTILYFLFVFISYYILYLFFKYAR